MWLHANIIIMHQPINISSKNDVNILNKLIKIIVNNPTGAKFVPQAQYLFIKNITIETKINNHLLTEDSFSTINYLAYDLSLEKQIVDCPSEENFEMYFPLCYNPDTYFQWFSNVPNTCDYFVNIIIEFADFDYFLLKDNDALTFNVEII